MSTIESLSSVASADTQVTPASGQADGANSASSTQDFQTFLKDFRKYESVIEAMKKAAADTKFKDELATIEHWFKVLNEAERNAAVNSLVQHSSQDQLKFFQSLISSMIKPDEPKATPVAQEKPKLGKLSFRPPSLNLPDHLDSPVTPTPITAKESATDEQSHIHHLSDALGQAPPAEASTKESDATKPLPGFSGINPYTLNMLANAGLSKDAQLLAAQLVMSGLVQPTGILQQPSAKFKKPLASATWRTPASARFPASALRSSGLRPTSSLKSGGLKSGFAPPQTPMSAGMDSPRVEDFHPDMLKDIPGWLRSLRLHKYTQSFDGLTWQEIVVLDDATLEAKGVAALGARRRLLRTFEHVRKEMGMEEPPNSATPTTSAMPTGAFNKPAEQPNVPHSAMPRSKLSINSPIFTPTWETVKTPQSAAPKVEGNEQAAAAA